MADEKKGGDTMKELRDWLVTKCRLPGFGTSLDRSGTDGHAGSSPAHNSARGAVSCQQKQYTAHVVTPRTIPQFVIPGSNDSSRQPSIGSNDDIHSHSSGEPSATSWSASTSPGISPRSSFSALAAPENNLVRIRSAPVSPRRDSHGFLRDFGVRSMSNLPHVQVDDAPASPNGQAGRTFSHSGVTLTTRNTSPLPLSTQRKGSLSIPGTEHRHRPRRMHRSSQDFYHSEERTVSSDLLHVSHLTAEYRGTYTGLTDKNEYLPMKESFRRSKRYYRRRSSLVTSDVMRLLYHQNSTDSNISTNGGSFHTRNRNRKQLAPIDPLHDKRHSSPEVTMTETKTSDNDKHLGLEKSKSNSLANLASLASPTPAVPAKTETERGDVKFSFQYFPATKRLKVILLRAEGLRFPEKPDLVLNPFVKICLMPGKLQKQSSEPARQTCAPVMNKEFFFTDFNLEEMKRLRLRILTFHKAHHLKLPEYIGEVNVPLSNYDLLMENRMWNDLHFKPYKKVGSVDCICHICRHFLPQHLSTIS